MFVCHLCPETCHNRRALMAHLRVIHDTTANIPCLLCDVVFGIAKNFNGHLRVFHENGNTLGPFLPPNWEEIGPRDDVPPMLLQPPLFPRPPPVFQPPAPALIPQIQENEDFDPQEPLIAEEMPNELPSQAFRELCQPFLESCFNKWLEFINHPDATVKSADVLCNLLMETVKNTINLVQPFLPDQESSRINSMLKYELLPFSTEHRRRKYLADRGLYSKPQEYLTSIDQYVAGTPDGSALRERRNLVAVIPLEKTLKAVLSNERLADSLVMPSSFTNAATLCHPFAGNRAQRLLNRIGEDCLLLELYMDEFTTTCPIGNSSAVYKMAAWYIRLLNFPLDMLSQLDHIMLACLAHAVDVMEDLQEIIKIVLLPQLKKLETEGITLRYRGSERTFKVILFRLSADNLGFHQLIGFTKCFSGNNPCWMCTETADTLRRRYLLNPEKLRTRQQYDQLVANGTPELRLLYGIRAPCCLNQLLHFHCMEDFSVDYMHDLHEGHFLVLLPRIFRDAISVGVTLESMNDAITQFGLVGSDGTNPLRPVYLSQNPDYAETLSGYTAQNSGILIRLLPLMFKCAQIHLQTDSWKLLKQLQRILDILYAPEITPATILMFDALVKAYLKEYIRIGGRMTVKPHKLLHYSAVMKEMGPVRHLATFRYEAKHQRLKQYAHSNRCVKNLQTTLADKHELMFAHTLQQMKETSYLANRRTNRSLAKFKSGLAVVYARNPVTRNPHFGEIQNYCVRSDRLMLKTLNLEDFDEVSHCFVVVSTNNVIEVTTATLLCPEPIAIYRRRQNYIRMPYLLP